MPSPKRDWERWENPEFVSSLEEYWKGDVFQMHRQKLKNVLADLFTSDPASRTVLEFGCGTGNFVSMVRELGREYSGVDITQEMLKVARQKYSDVSFDTDDIFDSKHANESYDVVLNPDVIVHLPEFDKPFATLYRIARRHVVLKLCYLTKRKGWHLTKDPDTFQRRNSQGFIEHFFNLDDIKRKIERHNPANVSFHVYESHQDISPYQAIVVVSKLPA